MNQTLVFNERMYEKLERKVRGKRPNLEYNLNNKQIKYSTQVVLFGMTKKVKMLEEL